MGEVEFVPTVVVMLARETSLVTYVQQVLKSVLEAALQLRRSQGVPWTFRAQPDDFLHICLGGYFLTYALDLEHGTVRVLAAVPMQERSEVVT